jgi:hypothetical protein
VRLNGHNDHSIITENKQMGNDLPKFSFPFFLHPEKEIYKIKDPHQRPVRTPMIFWLCIKHKTKKRQSVSQDAVKRKRGIKELFPKSNAFSRQKGPVSANRVISYGKKGNDK